MTDDVAQGPPVDALFEPYTFKGLSLPNRIVMAPMTRSKSPNGFPTDDVAGYYARRAAAEVGLIISEGTGVGRLASLNGRNIPRFHGERELEGWKRIIDRVHAEGGKMAPQLWHVGAVPVNAKKAVPNEELESPSGLEKPDRPLGRAMSDADIADTISAFAKAAANAKLLGFDAIELHGAHGYLIDQFFWDGLNRRDDRYGGTTIAARIRFAAEILREVRAAVGPDFPVILRLSQWKQQDYAARIAHSPAEMEEWLRPLVDAGADILHCSQRRFWEPEFEGSELNFAGWAKKLTGVPTIAVGSVGLSGEFTAAFRGEGAAPASLDELVRRMERQEFDLIAVGRALLQDPRWATKIHQGKTSELQAYDHTALITLS